MAHPQDANIFANYC